MPTYKIAVSWQYYSQANVEASSLEEAISLVEDYDFPLPPDGEYVDGSFEVDFPMTEELNKNDMHVLEVWERLEKERRHS